MSKYELLYIVPATYAENEIQKVVDAITEDLKKVGCEISRNENLGKLKLAYPINKIRYGYYIMVDFDLDHAKIKDLDRVLRLHSEVLRHQVVVKDPKAKPVFKLQTVDEIDRERNPRQADRDARTRQASAKPKTDGKKAEVDMKDIDKKLDKIVEGDIS